MGKAWSIGRKNTNKADILLSNDTVSKVHATLCFLDAQYYLIDNGSTNGTYLSTNPFEILDTHTVVTENDIIYFGEMKCTGKELILLSQYSTFTEISNNLIILDSKSQPLKVLSEPDIILNDSTPVKKIRCSSCMAIVFTNKPCTNCGNTKHMGEYK